MSIATIRPAIAVLVAAVSGVTKCYTQLPRGEINDTDLPCGLIFVRSATDPDSPEDIYLERRNYLMQLMVLPMQEGLDQGEAESKVEPFIPLVRDAFKGKPSLGGVSMVQNARLTGDSGPVLMPWGNVTYWGCEFRLTVEEYEPRVFSDSE